MDQYVPAPEEGWPRWTEARIRQSDFVLLVCTATYLRRIEGREEPNVGRGVTWEGALVYQEIYNAGARNAKFFPILLEGAVFSEIPFPLQGTTHYDLREPYSIEEAGYRNLYRRLTGQLDAPTPAVGNRLHFGVPETGAAPRKPNLGRLVAKMCDRRAQEGAFQDSYRDALQKGTSALICFISGELGECHESLVQRLLYKIDRMPDSGAEESLSAPRARKIAWQDEGESDQRYSRLKYSLFEEFDPAAARRPVSPDNLTLAALTERLRVSQNSHFTIQHEVYATKWDRFTAPLAQKYADFWNTPSGSTGLPPILIFINVVYTRPAQGWRGILTAAPLRTKLQRWRIQRAVAKMRRSRPHCLALAELPPVTPEDVLEWFTLNGIDNSEQERIRAVEEFFGKGGGTMPMSEVEKFCERELRKFIAAKGWDEHRSPYKPAVLGTGSPDFGATVTATAV